jgi:hypothetical protein
MRPRTDARNMGIARDCSPTAHARATPKRSRVARRGRRRTRAPARRTSPGVAGRCQKSPRGGRQRRRDVSSYGQVNPNPEVSVRLTTHPARTTAAAAAPLLLLLAAAACAKGDKQPAADSAAAAAAAATTTDTTHAMGAAGDADRTAAGAGGVPAGYVGRTDREGVDIGGAKYATADGGRWDVTTGPAHIIYAAKDSARGSYTAAATFEQLESPTHPEAYGIFIGGQNLDGPSQRYTYFLVRGTGQYLVKVRDGANTKNVVDWTSSPDVPKADASGKATYKLTAHTTADTVHFLVNGKVVAAAARSAVPTDGIAGVRINHNLHVRVTPLTVTK